MAEHPRSTLTYDSRQNIACIRLREKAAQVNVASARCRMIAWQRQRSADMRFYNFEIVIEKEAEDEGYSAYSPSLPGCFSNGRTIEEARRNMREAIQQHVASLLAHDKSVPQNERPTQLS